MKANALLKSNVDALLKARHQTRKDLAHWCRKSESWISKVMTEERREFPLNTLDRIADFFGLATYQLLQPGLTGAAERRKGMDRRSGKDRRISALNHQVRESVSSLIASITPSEVAELIRTRGLSAASRDELRDVAQRLERSDRENDARAARRRSADKLKGLGESSASRAGKLRVVKKDEDS